MREGYPLEDETGHGKPREGLFSLPRDKTFVLPHGRGQVSGPSGQRGDRDMLALERSADSAGSP